MPYPPGISRRDFERAGIITHSVECPECGAVVNEGEEHEGWCECEMTVDEMEEYWADEPQPYEAEPEERL